MNNKALFPIVVGMTLVAVFRKDINPMTRREEVRRVHEGIIVQDFGGFARVFNNAPLTKGGDIAPETAELFPIQSDKCWMEHVGERSEAFKVPATLRS